MPGKPPKWKKIEVFQIFCQLFQTYNLFGLVNVLVLRFQAFRHGRVPGFRVCQCLTWTFYRVWEVLVTSSPRQLPQWSQFILNLFYSPVMRSNTPGSCCSDNFISKLGNIDRTKVKLKINEINSKFIFWILIFYALLTHIYLENKWESNEKSSWEFTNSTISCL